jgi:hypothetical protein
VAERRGGAADEDRGRHVLGSAPTSCFWAGEGGRIHSAAACSGGSLSALTHDATTPAITLASSHGLHVGEPLLRAQTRWPISGRGSRSTADAGAS